MEFPIDLLSRVLDLQSTRPDVRLRLTRVGVKNVKLSLLGAKGSLQLTPTVDLFVDLPSDLRGVHLSRDPELLHEIMGHEVFRVNRIEELCEKIARLLLDKHKYASRSEVRLKSDYIVVRKPPKIGSPAQEPCKIFAMAIANREGSVNKAIGASVIGITACPCSQELLKTLAAERLAQLGYKEDDIRQILDNITLATHTQRTRGTILVQVPKGFFIDVEDLIDILEGSMSGRTYVVLKRPAEAMMLMETHNRPKFVEDVVRDALRTFIKRYADLPDETKILIQARSQESVHKHDIIAERVATLGDVRREIRSDDPCELGTRDVSETFNVLTMSSNVIKRDTGP